VASTYKGDTDMSKATAEPTLPRYSWTKQELREMSMTELAENLARVVGRMVEIAPS
jgi:hypothetical protein